MIAPLMAANPRYAIYFVPAANSALYRFGAAALGYDCFTGADVAMPDALPVGDAAWRELTAAPRRYGFHATLKAPFRLAAESDEPALMRAFEDFTHAVATVPAIAPVVRLLERFIAVVPEYRNGDLDRLAAACVRDFDRFRVPLSDADRARRHAAGLSARQAENLERWGYPYVFDDFRFHMTLTGALAPDLQGPLLAWLGDAFARRCGHEAVQVDRIALMRQDHADARFAVLRVAPIGMNLPGPRI
jgi:putative phosphonate metabolism protein